MGSSAGPPTGPVYQPQQQQSQQQQVQQQLLPQQYTMTSPSQQSMIQQQLSNVLTQQNAMSQMQYRQDNNPNYGVQENAYPQAYPQSTSTGYGYQNAGVGVSGGLSPQQAYAFQQTITPPTPNLADGYPAKPPFYPNKSGSIDLTGSARVPNSMSIDDGTASIGSRGGLRRNSRLVSATDNPGYNFQQAMSDHFDQYKRPPSRDSSVDRYSRVTAAAGARLSMGSRQPSVDKTGLENDRYAMPKFLL